MQSLVKPGGANEERPFPIVIIGASAGGLSPFERFLSVLPTKFGFALVFMQHLSPRHKNLLPDLLRSRIPGLKIEEASEGLGILPGTLYLCPPASEVRIEKGAFRVISRPRQHTHLPIDELLISLSEDAPERAIAVILSGAGTDGSRGVQVIKTRGGTVFIQDPATAEYPDMPLAAINTGQTDGVFPPESIAGEILRFHDSGVTAASDDRFMGPVLFDSLCQMMSERTGHHFDHYKPSVVARRVRRRMYLHGIATVNDYLKLLASRDQEAGQLASDLLIGVTSFFRDRLAWKALHLEVTRKLVAEDSATPIRAWTAACATGEEAYSVAMMLRHELGVAGSKRETQVFATDVNDRALERAREGVYPASISADLPPDYLRSYFTSSEDGLSVTVNKEIRQAVIFARQDLLTDPPFSRLDLIICRNLLIYLEAEAQERCISLFHYALKPGGYLFLGNAESPGRIGSLFLSLAHKKCRIYRKAEAKQVARITLSMPFATDRAASKQKPAPEHRQSIIHFIQAALLEEHAPAAVAINQNHDILYHNGPTNRYLRQPRGAPTQNLLDLLPEKLRNRIRGGLYRATQEAKPVILRTSITVGERHKQVFIHISKLQENLFLITFREKGNVPEGAEAALDAAAVEETAVHQLEQELASMRDDLQSHIEELKSVNEELESSNEELQAANEEMETSREELQSLNEELTTVNSQLQTKIEEQEETNNDLNNFLTSTSIPTIFLDHWLRVKRFTPAMARLITLIPGDIGRPIMDMSRENLGPDLIAEAQAVLDNLAPIRKELTINDASYVRTILPYRTGDNRIEGVVITYVDITGRIQAEETLRQSESRYRELVQTANSAIIRYKADGTITFFNEYAQAFFGYSAEEVAGRDVTILVPERDLAGTDMRGLLREVVEHPERHVNNVNENVCRDGRRVWMAWTNRPIFDENGRVAEILAVGSDVTELKRAEERIRHLASFPEINPNPILEVDASGKVTFSNPGTQATLERAGLDGKEATAFLPGDIDALLSGWDRQTDVMVNREVTINGRVFDEAIHLISGFNVVRIYARDITLRQRDENRIAGLARLYAVLSRVNETIVRVHDEQSLFTEVCSIMAEVGGFPLVWIGQVQGERVLPVAFCGLEADYLKEIKVETEGVWGQGPTGTCVRENRPALNDDFVTNPATLPWREQARLHGFHASAAFPLRRQGKVVGAFTLYAYEPDAFDAEQVGLLEALSADVSYALDALEQERLRVQAEAALRKAHDELETRVKERTGELKEAYEQLVQETKGREHIEAQLRQAQKMEALGTLTGGIAHDFNNILAAIIGFTEVVRDHIADGDHDRRHLDRVLEAGLRGRELIKRMLAFSRKTEQEKKPVLLGGIVTETVKFIRSSTPATISIRLDVKNEPGMVFADPVQMQQVVLNLCTNAVQAMREKGGVLDVEVSDRTVDESEGVRRAMKPGLYVKLAVRDTGAGISPSIMNRIFDPFFTTKKVGEGTGLGLSVVHGIVHQHEGYIFAESEAGSGSKFTVYLPMVEAELSGEDLTEHPVSSGTERVLFVDDEELLAEMGRDMLEDLGYQVTVTTSSSEALALFRTDPGRFDLVITDVTMPEITGVELAREMLAVRADIPIIMCTGFSHLIDADAAKAAGVRAFTMKPLTKREIAKTIRTVLDGQPAV
jgi:two-component system CheB/CheR fusion protein